MKSDEIRESFLRFFEERGHKRMPSAPLVPPGDPTLLFTSAGMVQFKPYFMGQAKPPHPRLTTVQKCFRTSDIDSVGDTSHLTFFEMLGNFSIGDYFKAEAIPWAWEYVTKVLGLPPERLWPAVYLDDDEAFELWRQVGVPEERIRRYGEEHNYWFSGPVGPCGPCSEIHYDFGEQFGCGPACEPDHEDCNRFEEIWNLVFMSYFCDGPSTGSGQAKRTPLPSKNIDTGAGLERMTVAVLHNETGRRGGSRTAPKKRPSVYDTDLFRPIIHRIEELSGKRYGQDETTDRAMRIVAEHARAVTFLIGEGVVPSNEQRGYAVRRILRRAVYFGRRYLGLEQPFLSDVAGTVIETMSSAYPELEHQRRFVLDILTPEEQRFEETLSRGLELLEQGLATPTGDRVLDGLDAFLLHDTYGFPLELTREITRERGFTVDEAGFQAEMEKQRERARAAAKGTEAVAASQAYASLGDIDTTFVGYNALEVQTGVLALLSERRDRSSDLPRADLKHALSGAEGVGRYESVDSAKANAEVEILLAETPFYPAGGGQVGDRGEIAGPNGRIAVEDTRTVAERLIVHRGRVVEGRIAVGDAVTARVDPQHRLDTMRNHTATHLLHAALRRALGSHVRQSGSLVAPDHLRFDFTHTEPLTEELIIEVQRLVNEKVRENLPVQTRQATYDQAMAEGVLAFFGEKYGDQVRVVEVNSVVPRFSAELCGGTHCARTGDIGFFIITGESSIGAGMRRIEALSGRGAEEYTRAQQATLDEIARRLGAPRESLPAKIESLLAEQDALRKRIERLERSLASAPTDRRRRRVKKWTIRGVSVSAEKVEATSEQALRYIADSRKGELGAMGTAVLGTIVDGKPFFVAISSQEAIARGLRADALIREVAKAAGGGGGGRPDMAIGGGKDAKKLSDVLDRVGQIAEQLSS